MCVLQKRMIVFEVRACVYVRFRQAFMFTQAWTYVCSTCTGHIFVFQWYTYVCPTCTQMCALIARVLFQVNMNTRVHTCVSELDTCFIVFQVNT